jgi:hypothetical protein
MVTQNRSSALPSPQIGAGALCFLTLAALLFLFVPRHQFFNMTGEWFDIGWPFPTGALKVGFVSADRPIGLHPHLDPTALLNAALWLVVILTVRRFACATPFLHRMTRVIIAFVFLVGAVWFAFGAFGVATALSRLQ